MLPALLPLLGGQGGGAVWLGDSRQGLAVSSGLVTAWAARDGSGTPAPPDAAQAPSADEDTAPGRILLAFGGEDRLELASPTGAPATLLLVFDASDAVPLGDRVLLTRDTSASTTKAAFEVSLISYFG